ncbi:MAG: polysaccharide pyruvyl transferase family protein, partial [Tetragenococcus halophilus]|nr:polysaccharide pyruvyl transferase family protein [Tetragenococcus halophilus]
ATKPWSHNAVASDVELFPLKNRLPSSLNKWGKDYFKNSGNLVHFEAITGIAGNPHTSVQQNLRQLANNFDNLKDFSKWVKQNFDGVVLSCANDLRSNVEREALNRYIEALDVPIFAFGLGLQDNIKMNELTKSNQRFLSLLNEKASIFAVRGEYTNDFLHSNGLTNSVALGCPSLYLYPDNLRSLSFDNDKFVIENSRIMTGGYLSPAVLKENTRTSRLIEILDTFKRDKGSYVSYVLQNELQHLPLDNSAPIYSSATSRVNPDSINSIVEKLLDIKKSPINSYYLFNDVNAWRTLASTKDFYLGDRFHGGVTALQSGVPACFLGNDLRLKELCEFFNLPFVTPASLTEDVYGVLEKTLENSSGFVKNYNEKYSKFISTCKAAGLEINEAM